MIRYLDPIPEHCPEIDGGEAYQDQIVYSARLWLPWSLNDRWTELIEERSVVVPIITYDARPMIINQETGKPVKDANGNFLRYGEAPNPPINLVHEHQYHFSVPRELFPEILAEEEIIYTHDVGSEDEVDFFSCIEPRTEEQALAFRAMVTSACGTMYLACGKGKTVCALNAIAEGGAPAVVLVANGGIAWQWKSRAMEFYGIPEGDIGFVQGDLGAEAYACVPTVDEDILEMLALVDAHMVRVQMLINHHGIYGLSATNRRQLVELFCRRLRLAPRSVTPSGEATVGNADVEYWANQGVLAANNVLEMLALKRRAKTLRDALYEGKRPQWQRKLVIVMMGTLVNRLHEIPMHIRQRFGLVVNDEAHHLPAPTFSRTAGLFFGRRFSLTATPDRDDGCELIMYAHTGNIIYEDTVPDDPARTIFVDLDTDLDEDDEGTMDEVCDRSGRVSVGLLAKWMSTYVYRNRQIVTHVIGALEAGRRVIVLVRAKAHPGILQADLRARVGTRYSSCVVTGDTHPSERTALIANHQVTFATLGVATEGLDAPMLDTLVYASPFSGWTIRVQGTGRIERLFDGKRPPLCLILTDPNIGMANGMGWSLRRKMKERGFEFENR